MTKILAISDVHGEENENLYSYLNNNDIDLVIILGDITDFGPLDFVSTFINSITNSSRVTIAWNSYNIHITVSHVINKSGNKI